MIIKVGRKIYNTETAEFIAETAQGGYGDSWGFEEKLFKRGPGDYFIYGHGGDQSPYPQPGLFVLSTEDARTWIERVMGSKAVDMEFNGGKKVAVKKPTAKKVAAEETKAAPAAKKAPVKKAAAKKVAVEEVKAAPAAKKPVVKKTAAEKAPKAAKAPKAEKPAKG